MDYPASNGSQMTNPYVVNAGGFMGYPPWLFSQSPAFSDISLPSDDLYRSQSAPPCLEQGHNIFCSPLAFPPLFPSPDVFSLASSTNGEPPLKEHIPRPPNAFMLYRSHMLKSRGNADPEKRQQNLSRIAGQLWREMSDEDKAVWHKKAAEVHAAHYAKYPHYKFKPNRKGIKSAARTFKSAPYQKPAIAESSMGPVRRARSRRVYPKCFTRDDLIDTLETQFPSSVSSSPGLSPLRLPPLLPVLSPETICVNEHPDSISSHPQFQPQHTNALGLELDISRPPTPGLAELLSDLARDLDATPTAATFRRDGNIPQPENALSQDGAFLGLEQLRLPHISTDYNANYLSPSVYDSAGGYQPSTQSDSCSESFGGDPPCASNSLFSDFGFSISMALDSYDEWSDPSWMLASDVDSKLNL